MKKLVLILALLCVSACIPVEDFGVYWDKGFIDHALQGKWEEVSSDREKKGKLEVTEKDGLDYFESLVEEDKKKDHETITARSLKAGSYMFFMVIDKQKPSVNPDNGSVEKASPPIKGLVRYEIKEGVFRQYSLNDEHMIVFLKEKYPSAKNIEVKKFLSSDSVEIKTLDDEVYKILSEIPDTKEFWKLQGEWHKMP